jgi:hypothetical protein
VLLAVGFCVVSAMTLLACGRASLSPPQGPAPDIETRVVQPKRQRDIPRLIAPPPAYGNKIVLAQAASTEATN